MTSSPDTSTARLDRRTATPKPKEDIKWGDLLDKFRSVQVRHEKARTKQLLLPRTSPRIDTPPATTPTVTQKRVSTAPGVANAPVPATGHKRGGRSIHTLTQGIINVGRGNEGKKVSGSGKRA